MMEYNGENSDKVNTNGETSSRKDNVGEEEAEDHSQGDSSAGSINKNNCSSEDLDPLTKALNSFPTLQEALEKEIQKFREIGIEASSFHEFVSRRKAVQKDSTSSDSQISALMKNIEYLEVKLEKTRSMLEVKESRVRQLESTINLNRFSTEEVSSTSESQQEGYKVTEIDIEYAFQQKIEAEIEYMILSRFIENLKTVSDDQMKMFEEQKGLTEEMFNKLGEVETKAEILKNRARELEEDVIEIGEAQKMKKKVIKVSSCLILQIVLLLVVICLFIFQMLSDLEIVVPT